MAIEWAKYLDWDFPNDPTEYTFTSDSLSKFAALVAAQEREACAAIILERGVDLSGLARDPMTQAFTEKLLIICAAAIRAREIKNEN